MNPKLRASSFCPGCFYGAPVFFIEGEEDRNEQVQSVNESGPSFSRRHLFMGKLTRHEWTPLIGRPMRVQSAQKKSGTQTTPG
jgi:hypothetical protein